MQTATICICTYNRAAMLRRMLGTLVNQDAGWTGVDVLVVDNNSTDDTAHVVDEFSGRLPIRCVREPSQGLSFARNRAAAESTAHWLIFADDDVLLDPAWLRSYLDALAAYPSAAYAAGRILPLWEPAPPTWFRNERLDLLDGVLVWFDQGTDTRPGDCEPFGASMAIRRDVCLSAGGFRTDLGVVGGKAGRGEETDLIRRMKAKGATGVYVGSALCWHLARPERFDLLPLFRYGVESGIAHRAIVDPSTRGSLLSAAAYLARGVLQAIKGRGDRMRQCVINSGVQVGLRQARWPSPQPRSETSPTQAE